MELIRETAMSALFRPETLYSEKLKHFYPTTFVLSARMCIQELSMEVLRTLKSEGVDVTLVQSLIPAILLFRSIKMLYVVFFIIVISLFVRKHRQAELRLVCRKKTARCR